MLHHALRTRVPTLVVVALAAAGCADDVAAPRLASTPSPLLSTLRFGEEGRHAFRFMPLASSATCAATSEKPFVVPAGFDQLIIAREGDGGTVDLWDMHTQNETGSQPGRYLYRTHEVGAGGQLSVTDLQSVEALGSGVTSVTRVVAQRADWERLDGIAWTPWQTVLIAEETGAAAIRDPQVPDAVAGLVYEVNPSTGAAKALPAVGSRSHEGLRFDPAGNLYGISEASPPSGGYVYKFVPDRPRDLSSGQLYALKIVESEGDRVGMAEWVALDREAVAVNSDAEATRVGATGYGRPEDVEIARSTGQFSNAWVLFVAITSENRILAIDLRPGGRDNDDDHKSDNGSSQRAYVYDYVRIGVNVTADFSSPDNLALDHAGNLYIAEDPGSNPVGADIWVANAPEHGDGGDPRPAASTLRFASLSDCAAEPTGIYFDKVRSLLYVHVQHRGAPDRRDASMIIYPIDE